MLRPYEVPINGGKTTLLLSDADAAARGLTVQAATPKPAADEPVPTKAKTPANKTRKPADK